jgi:hypothetical protein
MTMKTADKCFLKKRRREFFSRITKKPNRYYDTPEDKHLYFTFVQCFFFPSIHYRRIKSIEINNNKYVILIDVDDEIILN